MKFDRLAATIYFASFFVPVRFNLCQLRDEKSLLRGISGKMVAGGSVSTSVYNEQEHQGHLVQSRSSRRAVIRAVE